MEKIVFLGGNGLAIELYEYMKQDGINIFGYYAPRPDTLSEWVPYLGDERYGFNADYSYVVACGLMPLRKKLITFIEENNLTTYTYISKKAYISSLATIGEGAQIVPNTVISGNPIIGKYVFVNAFGMIAHQSIVGNNVVLSPGVKITGNCNIGDNVMMGSNVSLIPGTRIENDVEIGIGAIPKRLVKTGKFVKGPKSDVIDMQIFKSNIL